MWFNKLALATLETLWCLAQFTKSHACLESDGTREEGIERQAGTCVSGVIGSVCSLLDGSG